MKPCLSYPFVACVVKSDADRNLTNCGRRPVFQILPVYSFLRVWIVCISKVNYIYYSMHRDIGLMYADDDGPLKTYRHQIWFRNSYTFLPLHTLFVRQESADSSVYFHWEWNWFFVFLFLNVQRIDPSSPAQNEQKSAQNYIAEKQKRWEQRRQTVRACSVSCRHRSEPATTRNQHIYKMVFQENCQNFWILECFFLE